MAGGFQGDGGQEAAFGQMPAEQRQRVGAQAQAEVLVVGDQVFAGARRRQRNGRLGRRQPGEEVALHGCGRLFHAGRPGRLPAVAGQAAQGVGRGEQVEIAAGQAGAGGEIGDVQKWLFFAVDRGDPLCCARR